MKPGIRNFVWQASTGVAPAGKSCARGLAHRLLEQGRWRLGGARLLRKPDSAVVAASATTSGAGPVYKQLLYQCGVRGKQRHSPAIKRCPTQRPQPEFALEGPGVVR